MHRIKGVHATFCWLVYYAGFFLNVAVMLTGIEFLIWKRSSDCSAVMRDVFSGDKSCLLFSIFSQMLSPVLVVRYKAEE